MLWMSTGNSPKGYLLVSPGDKRRSRGRGEGESVRMDKVEEWEGDITGQDVGICMSRSEQACVALGILFPCTPFYMLGKRSLH